MFKKLLLGLVLACLATVSFAQTCPTRGTADSSNACASTAFVHNVAGTITSGITQLTGDVTAGPGSGSQAATLVTAQSGAHTWAAIQTFTLAPVFTDPAGTRAAIGSGAGDTVNCSLAASVSGGNALTISLKNQSGSDPSATSPCTVSFRSATASTGTYTSITVSSALSFATGTSGSTFGSTNNVPFRLWITAWNNAGTLVLGVSSQSTTIAIFPLNEGAVQSSTACNACTNAATAGVFYTTAAQTSKAIRVLGYMDWSAGLSTAGTWASGPTTIQNYGPGVNLPGAVVQTATQTTATAGTTTSATYVVLTTTPTVSLTPTSTINLVKVTMFGTIAVGNGGVSMFTQIGRGSTQIGSIASNNTGTANVNGAAIMFAFDSPQSVSVQTYVIFGKISGGVTLAFGGSATPVVFIAEEIQG